VHPVGARVGGFFHAPAQAAVGDLLGRLRSALPDAVALVEWAAGLDLPAAGAPFTSVALRHADEYPMIADRIVTSTGLEFAVEDFPSHVAESHVPHSTALFAKLHDAPYLVGPLARLNLNHDRLPASTRALLERSGIRIPTDNMFLSLFARTLEIHLALVEAIRLLEGYREPQAAYVEPSVRAASGCAATEAPRGLLWHHYELDDHGAVTAARIVPPTSQNQARLADDLAASLVQFGLDRPDEALRRHAETVIRNYDPCISCATHFLRLDVRR
jgi:coenzyme F420-reducing hydrogenase alpha subunit